MAQFVGLDVSQKLTDQPPRGDPGGFLVEHGRGLS